MKKLSELMLEGYAMVGKQCERTFFTGNPEKPTSVCAIGAACLAANGSADYEQFADGPFGDWLRGEDDKLSVKLGLIPQAPGSLANLNNGDVEGQAEPMSIADIAGIAAAEGL